MPAFVDKMAYAQATGRPWHGLGSELPAEASLSEWAKVAGLNWNVAQRPVLVQGVHSNKLAQGWKALVRSDSGDILDLVSDQYKPVQNREMLRNMGEMMDGLGVTMDTAGSLKGGRLVWALGKVPRSEAEIGGDKHQLHVLLSTGHQSGYAYQADLTIIRVVCYNTLSAAREADSEARYRHNHRSQWSSANRADALEVMKAGLREYESYAREYERFRRIELGQEETQAFVLELLQPELLRQAVEAVPGQEVRPMAQMGAEERGASLVEQLLEVDSNRFDPQLFRRPVKEVLHVIDHQPGAHPGTLANAFNGVTYYTDHIRGRSRESGLAEAWFGEGARLKNRAFDLAVEVADESSAGAARAA
jgi:phage/plasmid-like protein (TIGR03299 family)